MPGSHDAVTAARYDKDGTLAGDPGGRRIEGYLRGVDAGDALNAIGVGELLRLAAFRRDGVGEGDRGGVEVYVIGHGEGGCGMGYRGSEMGI